MKTKQMVVIMAGLFLVTSAAAVDQNRGAENVLLQGGEAGNVLLSHHRHQDADGECDLCHDLFARVSGSIQKLKAEGKLEKKAVMEQCLTCHRQKKSKGEKTGPTACTGCHKK